MTMGQSFELAGDWRRYCKVKSLTGKNINPLRYVWDRTKNQWFWGALKSFLKLYKQETQADFYFFSHNTDILGNYSIYSNINSQIRLKKLNCKNIREKYKNDIYLLFIWEKLETWSPFLI